MRMEWQKFDIRNSSHNAGCIQNVHSLPLKTVFCRKKRYLQSLKSLKLLVCTRQDLKSITIKHGQIIQPHSKNIERGQNILNTIKYSNYLADRLGRRYKSFQICFEYFEIFSSFRNFVLCQLNPKRCGLFGQLRMRGGALQISIGRLSVISSVIPLALKCFTYTYYIPIGKIL